jgi:transaldolase
MKIFADTANIAQIKRLIDIGLVDGVTTNPSLFAKEPKGDFVKMCQEISDSCRKIDAPLSVEVFSLDVDEAYTEALMLRDKINYDNLSIKVPIDIRYLPLIKKLSSEGIQVNATCGYTANQLIAAAACGARYVSLFYRRAIDSGEDVALHLQSTRKFIDSRKLNCEIIAGSIRTPSDILQSWNLGAHIATASPTIIDSSLDHAGTKASIEGFASDFSAWISR